jgi:uncharacterized membrane protein
VIVNPIAFVFIIISLVVGIKYAERRSKAKFFDYVPAVVVIYFVMIALSNAKLFAPDVIKSFASLKNYLLSSMVFLMLASSDIRSVYRMKTKLIVSYFVVTFTIMVAFVVMWYLLKGYFDQVAAKGFGALSASWTGGTANMIAVSGAVGLDAQTLGYCLVSDSINYAAWLSFLLFIAPFKDKFNAWTKAAPLDVHLAKSAEAMDTKMGVYALALAFVLPFAIIYLSDLLPKTAFVNKSFWIVVLSTVIGISCSFTKLSRAAFAHKVGFWMLYFLISLIAFDASFDDFSKAPLFILAGAVALVIHGVLAVIYAKLFRIDLFTISVVSLSGVGGMASAPILAASYDKNLVSVGVIMPMLGYIIGTFCGIGLAYVLGMM